jgi:hypothetical protein
MHDGPKDGPSWAISSHARHIGSARSTVSIDGILGFGSFCYCWRRACLDELGSEVVFEACLSKKRSIWSGTCVVGHIPVCFLRR